jgi:hypothetical protein
LRRDNRADLDAEMKKLSQKKIARIQLAIDALLDETNRDPALACSLLLKVLVVILIQQCGTQVAVERLSTSVNQYILELKRKKLIS